MTIKRIEKVAITKESDGHNLMVGAVAETQVSFDGGRNWKIDHLTSGGLYGIDRDADDSYIEAIEGEQLAELRLVLGAYGFKNIEIAKAFHCVVLQKSPA